MACLHGTFSVKNTGLQTHTHTYTHRIDIYSQLLLSTIRIVDINNCE